MQKTDDQRIDLELEVIEEVCPDDLPKNNMYGNQDVYINIHPFKHNPIWLNGKVDSAEGYMNASPMQTTFKEKFQHMIAT